MPRAVDGMSQAEINRLQSLIAADPEIQAILQQNRGRLQQTRDKGGSARSFQHQIRDQITSIAKRKGYMPSKGQYFINPNDGQLEPHGGWSGLSKVQKGLAIGGAAAGGLGIAGLAGAGPLAGLGGGAASGAGAGAGATGAAGTGGVLASSSLPAASLMSGPAAISGMGAGAGTLAASSLPAASLMAGPTAITGSGVGGAYGAGSGIAGAAGAAGAAGQVGRGLSEWLDPRTLASLGLSGLSAAQSFREPEGMDDLKQLFAASMQRSNQVQPLFDSLVKMTQSQLPDYARQG